jgi:3-oxoacyl-[acyl-carrier protein] reductase
MTVNWQEGDERSLEHYFTLEDVKRFVHMSGDNNALHVDVGAARNTAAGGVVVHGILAASFISTLIGTKIPGPGALWNGFSVQWKRPIRLGETILFKARITSVHNTTSTLKLEISGSEKSSGELRLQGTAEVMFLHETTEEIMDKTLENKRILITGAGGVLGRAIALRLAQSGAKPILMGRNEKKLRETSSVCGAVNFETYALDLGDFARLDSALEKIAVKGPLFGLIHVASPVPNLVSVSDKANLGELESQWRINVAAFARMVVHLEPSIPQGGGVVAILTQGMLTIPQANMSSYISAKTALWSLVQSMAVELGPKKIRCNAVSPGMMNTPFSEFAPISAKKIEEAKTPLRRLCTPEDTANVVHYLMGPESSFVHGSNIPVTGGLHG